MLTKSSAGAAWRLDFVSAAGWKGQKPEKKIILITEFFYNYSRI
jgi:hypothetical protein